MLRGRSFAAHDRILARLERGSTGRTRLFIAGIVGVLCGVLLHAARTSGDPLTWVGWAAIVAAVLHLAAAGLRPLGVVEDDAAAESSVARRYRDAG